MKIIDIVRGGNNLNKKKANYTPDLILTIILSIIEFNLWSDRIAFIESRHPEYKGHFNAKSLTIKSQKEGWTALVRKMRKAAMDDIHNETKGKALELAKGAIDGELSMAETLESERTRLLEVIPTLPIGSKAHNEALDALGKINKMVGKVAGTDRMRDRQALQDRAETMLWIAQQKDQLKLGGGNFIDSDEPIIHQDEEDFKKLT